MLLLLLSLILPTGGYDAISVYQIDYTTVDPTPVPTPAPTKATDTLSPGSGEEFEYVSCAQDFPDDARVRGGCLPSWCI